MGESPQTNVWIDRLQPNMVFEDHKALQKIEKSLRLIGFRDYRIYNSADIPSDVGFMNTFWICIPRNNKAAPFLARHNRKLRFQFIRKTKRSDTYISWRPFLRKQKKIIIASPLSKYLELQRINYPNNSEWEKQMSHIIAKDYAILARLNNTTTSPTMADGILKDYFLAGIRGLGTWGAGWFIDRKYNHFLAWKENAEIQILLEVTYQEGRVIDVQDVSNKNQEYFFKENEIVNIKRKIEEYNGA